MISICNEIRKSRFVRGKWEIPRFSVSAKTSQDKLKHFHGIFPKVNKLNSVNIL